MSALELVDAGLQLVSQRGQLSQPSPGVAIIDGNDLVVGIDAECSARLKPRSLHSRFWQELNTAPLGRPFPSHLRTADLAHAHLQEVWDTADGGAEELMIAVPGVYRPSLCPQTHPALALARSRTRWARGHPTQLS